MTLSEAMDKAYKNSLEGYVQHVNKSQSGYIVSDWYDGDCTVISFENGVVL